MERSVYNISKLMNGPELRYSIAKKVCLSLYFVVSKFNHYFPGHRI